MSGPFRSPTVRRTTARLLLTLGLLPTGPVMGLGAVAPADPGALLARDGDYVAEGEVRALSAGVDLVAGLVDVVTGAVDKGKEIASNIGNAASKTWDAAKKSKLNPANWF